MAFASSNRAFSKGCGDFLGKKMTCLADFSRKNFMDV